jgi:hypothetical protein
MKIPPVIMQTSKNKQPEYVIEMIKSKSVGWKYEHFVEPEIQSLNESNIKLYIEKRPTPPFPNPWAVNSYDGENIILKHYPRTKMIPRD